MSFSAPVGWLADSIAGRFGLSFLERSHFVFPFWASHIPSHGPKSTFAGFGSELLSN